MISQISEEEFSPFFSLMAEIECGDHFDPGDVKHQGWLEERVHRRYASGAQFYALHQADGTPLGIVGLVVEKPLHSEWSSAELVDIGIFPQYRGMGYGTQLLKFVEEQARG